MAFELAGIWVAPLAAATIGASYIVHCRVRGWLPEDAPAIGRKQHARTTPLVGIALLPVLLGWQIFAANDYALAFATAALGVVGHLDDLHKSRGGLSWRIKAVALGIATAVVAAEHAGLQLALPFVAAWALAFVLVNATNFLDNTNGTCAAITAGSLLGNQCMLGESSHSYVAWTALGFLPWNWPRSRVFLGDSGAYALGIAVADRALANLPLSSLAASEPAVQLDRAMEHWALSAVLLLPFAVQLIDFAQVVCVRLWLGVAPWRGDRRHLTHIAQNLGLPAALVAPLFLLLAFAPGWAFVAWIRAGW
jgi:UDP-N-acetylmuramyl pentapeptide phosphotransferase/UDP-N-acetylglucosamine-1-phosphate transferase